MGTKWKLRCFFKLLDAAPGMRVPPEKELEGLDVAETGVHGYPAVQGSSSLVFQRSGR